MFHFPPQRLIGFLAACTTVSSLSGMLEASAVYAAPPVTLDQALKAARWNPERQGPLLVVDPVHTTLAPGQTKVSAAGIERASLRALADHFGRKLVPLGSLTVLAPTTMVIIGPPLGPPTATGALEGADPLRYLLATLKSEQWQAIIGNNGLPVSALSPQQQVWLERIAPAPGTLFTTDAARSSRRPLTTAERDSSRLRLSRELLVSLPDKDMTPGGGMGFRGLWLNHGTPAAPVYMLTTDEDDDAEQTQAKDRKPIIRRVVPSVQKPGDLDLSSSGLNAALLSRPVSLAPDAGGRLTLGTLIQRASKATRLELYSDQRVARLPLWVRAGSGGASVRAGDLLQALCWGVTGTFRRVGPAGGPAGYVLTDDLEGIGSRVAKIVEWERAASVLSEGVEAKAQASIKAANVGNLVKYAPDDPFALAAPLMLDMLRRYVAQYGEGPYAARHSQGEDLSFPVDQLPPAFRQFAEEQSKKAAADPREPRELRTDRLRIEPGLYLALLLPDGGTVRAKEVMEGEVLNNALNPDGVVEKPDASPPVADTSTATVDTLPLSSLFATEKPVVLAASAATMAEAQSLVRSARRYGFAQVWLQTPPTKSGREALAAAVAEGQAKTSLRAVPVWAAVSLLKSEDSSADSANTSAPPLGSAHLDQNILGDTPSLLARRRAAALDIENSFTRDALRFLLSKRSDFLRFDTPALALARMRPVIDLADVPGLAGIALSDTAAPGYGPFHEGHGNDWYTGLQDSGDFGYSPETRLAFLRQEGYDPIDLSLSGTAQFWNGTANLPFFPSSKVPLYTSFAPRPDGSTGPKYKGLPEERWTAFRREKNEQLLATLYQKLREKSPRLPVMLAERSGGIHGPVFWAQRDAAGKLPYHRDSEGNGGASASKDLRAVFKTVYSTLNVPPEDAFATVADYASILMHDLNNVEDPGLNNTLRTDGLIVDLRALSLKKKEEFLRRALQPKNYR